MLLFPCAGGNASDASWPDAPLVQLERVLELVSSSWHSPTASSTATTGGPAAMTATAVATTGARVVDDSAAGGPTASDSELPAVQLVHYDLLNVSYSHQLVLAVSGASRCALTVARCGFRLSTSKERCSRHSHAPTRGGTWYVDRGIQLLRQLPSAAFSRHVDEPAALEVASSASFLQALAAVVATVLSASWVQSAFGDIALEVSFQVPVSASPHWRATTTTTGTAGPGGSTDISSLGNPVVTEVRLLLQSGEIAAVAVLSVLAVGAAAVAIVVVRNRQLAKVRRQLLSIKRGETMTTKTMAAAAVGSICEWSGGGSRRRAKDRDIEKAEAPVSPPSHHNKKIWPLQSHHSDDDAVVVLSVARQSSIAVGKQLMVLLGADIGVRHEVRRKGGRWSGQTRESATTLLEID
jgi:hypothetical protein